MGTCWFTEFTKVPVTFIPAEIEFTFIFIPLKALTSCYMHIHASRMYATMLECRITQNPSVYKQLPVRSLSTIGNRSYTRASSYHNLKYEPPETACKMNLTLYLFNAFLNLSKSSLKIMYGMYSCRDKTYTLSEFYNKISHDRNNILGNKSFIL